jgi:cellulose synthase/poly-beta-1,6-N-acetylglucosamine synthase-like glycosyltransferase
MIATVLDICVVALAVPLCAYPALLYLRARLWPRPLRSAARFELPAVDLVICAHNEAAAIGERIENALALDYPQDRLRIWIASDGSMDQTVTVARSFDDPRLTVLDLPRLGKAAALRTAVEAGSAPVLAFSDANSDWETGALRALVAPFADPEVGGVAGDQRYRRAARADGTAGERGYWHYDRLLKHWQSVAGSTVSATGAIYAIRRDLFDPPPPDGTDDFMISTGVVLRGSRLAFASAAVAWEQPAQASAGEWRRKVRVISRGLRAVWYRRALLDPRRFGSYALLLLVHKLWRRLLFLPLSVLLLCAPLGFTLGGRHTIITASACMALAAAVAAAVVPGLRRSKPFAVAYFAFLVNLACAVASYNLVTGRRVSHWATQRPAHTD